MNPTQNLIDRLARRLEGTLPGSDAQRAAGHRIGLLLTNLIRLNIRNQRLIDTGRLWNSVSYNIRNDSEGRLIVEAGSYGVPYAAIHEFGFAGSAQVRAHERVVTRVFGKVLAAPVTQSVSAHTRKMNVPARPFVFPALESAESKIGSILRGLVE
jgi:phage gpG-like protein